IVVGDGTVDMAAWLDAAHQRKMPTLHAHVGAAEVEVGPLFMAGKSACYEYFRRLRETPRGAANAADLHYWSSVVALHAFHLVSRIGTPSLYNICHVHGDGPGGRSY